MKSKNLHVRQVRWRRAWLWWLAPGAWAAALFVASSIPGTSYPEVSFAFADKVVHIAIYAVFGALLGIAAAANFTWTAVKLWLLALALATVYGATDEVHQMFVPNRSPDVRDLLADLIGAALGAAVTLAFISWRQSRHARRV